MKTHNQDQMNKIADLLTGYLEYSLTRKDDEYNVFSFQDINFITDLKAAAFVPDPINLIIIPTQPQPVVEPEPHRIVPIIKDWKRNWKKGTVYNENDCRNIIRDYLTWYCQKQVESGMDWDVAFDNLMNSRDWKGHKQHIQNTKTGIRIKVNLKYTVVLRKLIPAFTQKKGNKSNNVLGRIVMD
jgi:hypothetical protein